MRTAHATEVSQAMKVYWSQPDTRVRRALQTKIRERQAQLERLERHGMVDSDRYRHILSKLEQARAALEQL